MSHRVATFIMSSIHFYLVFFPQCENAQMYANVSLAVKHVQNHLQLCSKLLGAPLNWLPSGLLMMIVWAFWSIDMIKIYEHHMFYIFCCLGRHEDPTKWYECLHKKWDVVFWRAWSNMLWFEELVWSFNHIWYMHQTCIDITTQMLALKLKHVDIIQEISN